MGLTFIASTAKDCFSRPVCFLQAGKDCRFWGSDSAREGLGREKCPLRRGTVAASEGFGTCHTVLGPSLTPSSSVLYWVRGSEISGFWVSRELSGVRGARSGPLARSVRRAPDRASAASFPAERVSPSVSSHGCQNRLGVGSSAARCQGRGFHLGQLQVLRVPAASS